jgi:G3E family GTPase
VAAANAIILSHTDVADEETIEKAIDIVNELNDEAEVVSEPVTDLPIEELLNIIVSGGDVMPDFEEEEHHHDEDEDEDEHEHHHDHEHHHEHHHDHDHHHHHHHHDDDDEDEPFLNLILRPTYRFSKEELSQILEQIPEDIIRVKGYVLSENETLYFNYVLNEYSIFAGTPREEALVSIIGTEIDEHYFEELFHD